MTMYKDSMLVESQLQHAALVTTVTSTATTASGTLTLTSSSNCCQVITGTATGYMVKLPDATTLTVGQKYEIFNQSTQSVSVVDSASGALVTAATTSTIYALLQANGTAAGTWIVWQLFTGSGGGVISYQLTSNTAFTTTSATLVVITSFTLSPIAGLYVVWASGSWQSSQASNTQDVDIFNNGTAVSNSARTYQSFGSSKPGPMYTQTITQVASGSAVDVRVSTTAGTLTVNERSLVLLRIGN